MANDRAALPNPVSTDASPLATHLPRFTLIGSSHLFGVMDQFVGAIPDNGFRRAWDTGVPATGPLSLGDLPGWQGGYVLYNTPAAGPPPEFRDQVLYLPDALIRVLGSVPTESRCIFSLMRGQEFAIAALVDHPDHADFIDADAADDASPFEPGRRWMSHEDAVTWVNDIARPLLTTHLALRCQFPAARIVHVPAPPPVEDEAHILANAEGFGPLFAQHGVKPFAMRRRIYRLMYAELGRQLAEHGIASLAPPAGALTPAGGLRADFARGCLHGNERYAELLAGQIREVLHAASV